MSSSSSTSRPKPSRPYQRKSKTAVNAEPDQRLDVKFSHASKIQTMNSPDVYNSYRKQTSAMVHPCSQTLVDQIINPEAVNNPERWPNTYGLSALYKCKNVINARYSDDDRSCIAVHPRLSNAILTTIGNSNILTINAQGSGNNPYAQLPVSLDVNSSIQCAMPIYLSDNEAVLSFPNSNTQLMLYPLACTAAQSNNTRVLQVNGSNAFGFGQFTINIKRFDASYTQVSQGSVGCSVTGVSSITLFPTSVTDIAYISITVSTSLLPYEGDLTFSIHDSAAAAITIPNHTQHCQVINLKDAETIVKSSERYTVLAQSLLVTAQMSTTKDGGQIAIARLPGSSVVGEQSLPQVCDDWYEFLASLPKNNYDGPTKNGAYSFYLPEDDRGFFYRQTDSLKFGGLPYIVSEHTAADISEGTIVRYKIVSIVQFTTNSSVYDSAPSEFIGEDEARIRHALSLISSSYDNGSHVEKLKQALGKASTAVMKVLKNPKTYTTAARIASMLL